MVNLIKVENPKQQTMKEIAKDYLGYWILISNLTDDPIGGIVRYYVPKKCEELWDKWFECESNEEIYGSSVIRSAVPGPAQLGGMGVI